MSESINILIEKLNQFIRKYYLNKLIRGSIFYGIIFLSYFLIVASLEHFAYFSMSVRTIFFYSFILLLVSNTIWFILIPLLKYFQVVKTIDYQKASQILSAHFPELKDTITNSLELQKLLEGESSLSSDLIIASINQKIDTIKPIPFVSAINFKVNFRYARYLGGVLAVFVLLLVTYPQLISNGAERIVNHNTHYIKPAPFTFTILNDKNTVEKGKDYTVQVSVSGDYVPADVYIASSDNFYFMKKLSNSKFEYTFRNIYNDFSFSFSAEGFNSQLNRISVLPSPQILSFSIDAKVPAYTGIKSFISQNTGDLTVPEGTDLNWLFKTESIDNLTMKVNDSIDFQSKHTEDDFSISYKAKKSFNYSVAVKNEFITSESELNYTVNVIPDYHPEIEVISNTDSINPFVYYFKGQVNDDYGFNKLRFNYFINEDKSTLKSVPVQFNKNLSTQSFFYIFDFSDFEKGQKVSYYFTIWDNDQVNGSKSASTSEFMVSIFDDEELRKAESETNSKIEDNLKKSAELTDELQDDLKKLKEKFLTENTPKWQKQELMKEIKEKNDELNKIINEMKQQHSEISKMNEMLNEEDKALLEKQKQIEELLENLMDEELQKLMDEFNELMEDFNQKEFFKMSEELEMSYEDLEEKLDRDIEMLKQYEVERKLESTIDKLDKLSEEQKETAQDIKDKAKEKEEQLKDIDKQIDDLNKIEEEYKEAIDKNEELENKMKLDEFEQDFQEMKKTLEQSKENLQQNQKGKSSKQQQKGSQQSKDLSQKMQQQMAQNFQMQQGENMEDMRQLIDNLLTFSLDQEALIADIKVINATNPLYVEYTNKQSKLIDNFEIVKDSLYALAKRTPQVSATINEEVKSVLQSTAKALANLENRRKASAAYEQQVAMTSTNNLLLLLGEAMDQMMQQQAQQMPGQQMCQNPQSKPGGGKPSMQRMKDMQESLKKQMQQMLDQMKKDGGKKPGGQSAKQISEMLQKQEMARKMLEDMLNGQSISPEGQQQLKEIKRMMEQNEKDFINRNITPDLINRQNRIMTRMLEAEKSEDERDKDKERKSEETKQQLYSNPEKLFEYKNEKEKFDDILKYSTIKLNQHYKKKYEKYLIHINSK